MANSIAKLAILMTADTSGLSTGMARAQLLVKGFSTNVNSAGKASQLLLGTFTKGTGLLAATALLTTFAYRAAAAASSMGALENGTDRWRESIDSLNASMGQFFRTLGESTSTQNPFQELSAFGSRRFDEFSKLMGGETGAEFKTRMAGAAAETKAAAERLKEYAKAAEEASEKHRKFIASMKERAGDLVSSLRTPAEVFADTISEIQQLSEFGFLDPENATRGILRAKKELLDTLEIAKEFKRATDVRVGAVTRDTMAGFSAVQAGRAELKRIADDSKASLVEDKKQTKLLEEANALTRTRKPIIFQRSRL